jgi:HD-GYP domain-containing protein (c-di-GMP phosphodiesterase class II)
MSQPDLIAWEELAGNLAASDLLPRLDSLRQENEALSRELLRCYEQLNLVFEITETLAQLRDPEIIRSRLLSRFGETIGASALFIFQDGNGTRLAWCASPDQPPPIDPAALQQMLQPDIEHLRRTQRARLTTAALGSHPAGGFHGMLVPLRQHPEGLAVVIALREPTQPPFDSGDVLASESVLGYGGLLLSNLRILEDLRQTALETVRALANAIDAKDNYTCGHSERVGWLARQIGAALDLPENVLDLLEWAGILHDVGKIGISEQILNKPGSLDPEELAEMKRHPVVSYEVLKPIARLNPVLGAVLHHHENWDGSGYPFGLRGEEIPVGARIIRIADTFDALTSTRAYRRGYSLERALQIMEAEAGRLIDPRITAIFVGLMRHCIRQPPADFRRLFSHLIASPDGSQPGGPAGLDVPCGHNTPPHSP